VAYKAPFKTQNRGLNGKFNASIGDPLGISCNLPKGVAEAVCFANIKNGVLDETPRVKSSTNHVQLSRETWGNTRLLKIYLWAQIAPPQQPACCFAVET